MAPPAKTLSNPKELEPMTEELGLGLKTSTRVRREHCWQVTDQERRGSTSPFDRITTMIQEIVKGDSTKKLGKSNEMGVITRDESSDYGTGMCVVTTGGEAETSNWDNDSRKGDILMSAVVHISECITDEHAKGSGGGEQIPKTMFHSRDVEKGLGWAR